MFDLGLSFFLLFKQRFISCLHAVGNLPSENSADYRSPTSENIPVLSRQLRALPAGCFGCGEGDRKHFNHLFTTAKSIPTATRTELTAEAQLLLLPLRIHPAVG